MTCIEISENCEKEPAQFVGYNSKKKKVKKCIYLYLEYIFFMCDLNRLFCNMVRISV